MAKNGQETSNTLKYATLLTLTIQNTLLIVSMRYSRLVPDQSQQYITTTAVVFSEFAKMCICLIIVFTQQKSFGAFAEHIHHHIIVEWKDTLKMSIPAIVYMIQNNLQYVAVSNLEPAIFQVTYQLKILTTALFSVLLLSKKLSTVQWSSLCVLFVGVALVQVPGEPATISNEGQNQYVGLIAVIISCLSSGFAGVYFEMMLKGYNVSVWVRNIQLGMFGSITAILGVLLKDLNAIKERGFFVGYTPLVWTVIAQQAVGGLIVALVVRYADNILKGFATSLSIIFSCILSMLFLGYTITYYFVVGAALVMVAIYLYGKPQATPPPSLPISDKKDSDATEAGPVSSKEPTPT